MYLEAHRSKCKGSEWEKDAAGHMVKKPTEGLPKAIKDIGITSSFITTTESYEIGYWRKVNHIHKWFVDNCGEGVDECQEIYVRKEDLMALRSTCMEVLANRGDEEKVSELLPCSDGFFFGSTEYDDYYYDSVERTIEILDKALKLCESKPEDGYDHWQIIYQASW